jgi:transcriptional regulator with XRE-family HTH domain
MGWNKVSTTKDRLKIALTLSGKKQIDLVNETGINRGTISRYLSGKYEPKADTINKLAMVLDCSEMWLWGYDVPRKRSPEQKKNDAKTRVINRIKTDEEFAEMIIDLDTLDESQLLSIKQLLTAFKK